MSAASPANKPIISWHCRLARYLLSKCYIDAGFVVDKLPEADREMIAGEILEYLDDNPEAMDTATGITQWWLVRQRYLRGLTQIEAALQLLLDRGKIRVQRKYGQQDLYGAVKSDEGERS